MTDNEIIKALECCMDEMGCKKGCPCFDPKAKGSNCTISKIGIEKIALDLINRQQAEIERLEKVNDSFTDIGKLYSEVKAEAIKEFADRLKINYSKPLFAVGSYNEFIREVDNLVKEMVGE
jgi:hypothetical protein